MLKSKNAIFSTIVILMLVAAGLQAATYVSLNGKFLITYPDDWDQIDYNTVDLFLTRSGAEQSMFDYDAVFAPKASSPFFSGDYLILTVEKVGELSALGRDSIIQEFGKTFKSGITYISGDNFTADLQSNVPVYDRNRRIITVVSDVFQGQQPVKKNMIMLKFYDQGIATFYFYSTDSLFESSRRIFEDIAASFSTENIESALPREEVKVADIETDPEGKLKQEDSKTLLYLSIAVFILLVLVALYARRSRK